MLLLYIMSTLYYKIRIFYPNVPKAMKFIDLFQVTVIGFSIGMHSCYVKICHSEVTVTARTVGTFTSYRK
jgi:hypothetical protein